MTAELKCSDSPSCLSFMPIKGTAPAYAHQDRITLFSLRVNSVCGIPNQTDLNLIEDIFAHVNVASGDA